MIASEGRTLLMWQTTSAKLKSPGACGGFWNVSKERLAFSVLVFHESDAIGSSLESILAKLETDELIGRSARYTLPNSSAPECT